MKKAILLLSIVIILLAVMLATNAQVDQASKPNLTIGAEPMALPASLDKLYPPQAKQPLFLARMHEMSDGFTGIVVDLFENDFENVESDYENFRTKYVELSRLVPEWSELYPMPPIEKLGAVLKTHDPGKVMPAIGQVGEICNECHFTYMPKVQSKYHWRNFQSLTVTDPLTNKTVSFAQIMQFVDANLSGIEVDLRQGQVENARKQQQALLARYHAMSEVCIDCHDSERHYYTDESVMAAIENLGEALNADNIDPALVGKYGQEIGTESCFKCHLVHVPAAAAQWQMSGR
jgi:hypothetical protein